MALRRTQTAHEARKIRRLTQMKITLTFLAIVLFAPLAAFPAA
jgi:uncharacterized membrane protein